MKISNTAERLKQIIKERNLKQVDIIRMAAPYCTEYRQKLSRSDLSQFISGKVVPGQWKLTLIALALDVSEAWLMGYDAPKERQTSKPPVNDEELLDEELIRRLCSLSPDEMQKVDAFVQGLLANR